MGCCRRSLLQHFFIMATILFLVLFLLSGFFTFQRNEVWKNEYTLWRDVVLKSPTKNTPHINLGNAFIRRGALDRAEQEFLIALAHNKFDARALSGLGVVYSSKGLSDKAIRVYKFIIADKPDYPPAHNNLGVVYLEKGLLDEAVKEFKTTIRLDPNFSDAHANLGLAYMKKGRLQEAEHELEDALRLRPEHPEAGRTLNEVKRSLQN